MSCNAKNPSWWSRTFFFFGTTQSLFRYSNVYHSMLLPFVGPYDALIIYLDQKSSVNCIITSVSDEISSIDWRIAHQREMEEEKEKKIHTNTHTLRTGTFNQSYRAKRNFVRLNEAIRPKPKSTSYSMGSFFLMSGDDGGGDGWVGKVSKMNYPKYVFISWTWWFHIRNSTQKLIEEDIGEKSTEKRYAYARIHTIWCGCTVYLCIQQIRI